MLMKKYLFPYGWIGIVILALSGWLLYCGNSLAGIWFTPVMWSGYILFIDNVIYGRTGKSLISLSRAQLPIILILSIGSWLIFEGYNVYLKNWHYMNLPEKLWIRYTGYAWAFATITPAILITADFLKSFNLFDSARSKPFRIKQKTFIIIIIFSVLLSLYPLIFPNEYLFPLVWCSFIFLVDPANYLLGGRSLFRDMMEGKPGRMYRLLLTGLICGLLWEFWNYWAAVKWIYTVPYFPGYKFFEMPAAGYLGFPPFAVECYVIYQLFKVLLEKAGITLRYA